MSLQVWLPLTKDLRQQGLASAYKVGSNTATLTTGGKLGGCYNFTATTGSGMLLNNDVTTFMNTYINNHSWSLCAWIKNSVNNGDTCVIALTYGLLLYGGSSTAVKLYNSARTITCTSSVGTGDNQWHHLVATYNVDTNAIKIYVDGINTGNATYTSGYTYASSWTNGLFIGRDPNNSTANAHYFYQGQINDVRIYDHCLSLMEVKELAKGLVLHYPLNRQGWGQENLVWNSNWYLHSTTPPENWYNWGSPPTREIVTINNKNWLHVISNTTSFQGYSQNWTKRNGVGELTAGQKITVSFTAYLKTAATIAPIGIHWCNSSGTIISQNWTTTALTTDPKRYSFTYTTPANCVAFNIMVGDNTNTAHEVWITDIKLEFGEIATPWCPNSSDTLATTMGLNSTTEYDCSGFCNNGTRTGTFEWTSNTPKYAVSQVFNGTNNAIQTPSLPTMITDKNYTIAVWIYKTVIGSKGYQTIYGGPSGFEIEARNGSANETKFVPWNWGKPMASYELNEWNHCVFVHSDSDCKIYLNGEYIATGTAKTSNPTGNYFIGAWNTATQQNFDGLMSDFRIYATALSADDVKSLYQNSAYIDSSGNVYGAVHEV